MSLSDVNPGRIRLSKWLASGKHSKHVHYAFKMALGVMLLGLPAYLPLGSAGMFHIERFSNISAYPFQDETGSRSLGVNG